MSNKNERQGDFFDEYKPNETALVVNEGVEQPPVVSPYLQQILSRRRNVKSDMTVDDYMDGILNGDRVVLSKAITLVESSLPAHREMARELIVRCLSHSKIRRSMRIGITGVPGAGKSTFIESFGNMVTGFGHNLAVLAIDPSSEKTKGSIALFSKPKQFIEKYR